TSAGVKRSETGDRIGPALTGGGSGVQAGTSMSAAPAAPATRSPAATNESRRVFRISSSFTKTSGLRELASEPRLIRQREVAAHHVAVPVEDLDVRIV